MVFEWCGRARKDLQNNLRGPVCLRALLHALSTGPRASRLLSAASCFFQHIVTIVGITMVLVCTRLVCSTVPITTGDRAAGRNGGRGCRCASAGIHRSCDIIGRVAGRVVVRISSSVCLCFDDYLRALGPTTSLVVRHHERRILFLRDAHVITGVRLLHYMTWTFGRNKMD